VNKSAAAMLSSNPLEKVQKLSSTEIYKRKSIDKIKFLESAKSFLTSIA
jgi:hypothetical protein